MLEILSKEQEGLLWRTMETWFNNAYVRKDFNKDIIEDSISWLYSMSGLKKPEILVTFKSCGIMIFEPL